MGQLSPRARTTEHAPWSPQPASTVGQAPQRPCSKTGEATTVRSPCTANRKWPQLTLTRESPHSNGDPAQPRIKTQMQKTHGASLVAQTVKNLPAMQGPGLHPWVRKVPWRRAWQPIPVFLPGESHGQRPPAEYSPQDSKESDTTEETQHARMHGIQKDVLMNLFSGQEQRHRHRELTCGLRGDGEGWMN